MANVTELYNGVKVLMKYEEGKYTLAADHDQFWCGATNPEEMTEGERKIMEDNGWVWDDSIKGWFIFT